MQSVRIKLILWLVFSCPFLLSLTILPAWPNEESEQACGDCHLPHPAGVTREIHPDVECESCHLENGALYPDPASGQIRFRRIKALGIDEDIHDELKDVSDEASCRECHFRGNPFGAAAAVLPAKGLLCLPCHAATFSVGHPLTLIALLLFGIGMVNLLIIWKRSAGTPVVGNHKKLSLLIKVFIFTRGLLSAFFINQRLFKQSPGRWLIHGLMIYSIIIRFLWGLAALLGSLYLPQWPFIWTMLDRNHPATAFFYDFTGSLMLLGFLMVLLRHGIRQKPLLSDRLTGLPGIDWPGFALLGLLIMSGFVQQALRMAMSFNGGTPYAFVGYHLSRLVNWADDGTMLYVYFWYAHFILTAALVAYLPFSRLKHMVMGPVSLALRSVHENGKARRHPDSA